MNATQENKLSMYYVVQKVCSASSAVWNGLLAFVNSFNDFETTIGKIEAALETQEKNLTGVSKDKDSIENSMIAKALLVAKAVFAYATDNNNETLKSKVDYSESELKKVRDSFTLQRCQGIHTEANNVVNSLGNYGVTPIVLSDFQTKIDAYSAAIASPRTAVTERKGATDEIDLLQRKSDSILKNKMDKLAENFRESNPDFYRAYFDARLVIDSGTRKTFLKGKVKSIADGKPVENVTVELKINISQPNETSKKTVTDKSGEFVFESVPAGEHNLKVSKEGFETAEVDKVKVERGRINVLEDVGIKKEVIPS